MSISNQFAIAMQALEELAPKLDAAQAKPIKMLPSLQEVLNGLGSLPRQALFLGIATDGLPVLLSLRDPSPGSLLLTGDTGCGKTALLKVVACAIGRMHDVREVRFGVITNHPDEWKGYGRIPHCVGIFPMGNNNAADFVSSLTKWAHSNRGKQQSILLLLDDLEAITHINPEIQPNLRWLLLRGPVRRVWPIITLNTEMSANVSPWLEAFRTRIFGHVDQTKAAEALLPLPDAGLDSLAPGMQFCLREGTTWLRFWIPKSE